MTLTSNPTDTPASQAPATNRHLDIVLNGWQRWLETSPETLPKLATEVW